MAAKEYAPVTVDPQAAPISDEEMYGLLEMDATLIPADHADSLIEIRTSRDIYSRIKATEGVVASIITSEQKLTISRTSRDGSQSLTPTRRGAYVAAILQNFPFEVLADKVLSVRLELFKRVVANLGGVQAFTALLGHYRYPPKTLDEPNFIPRCRSGFIERLFYDLQQQAKSRAFLKDLREAENRSAKILEQLVNVVRNLFESYAGLSIIRVDFGYHRAARDGVDAKSAKKDLRKFLNGIRHRVLFNDLIGAIWKAEEGVCGGAHFHCIFFFDGAKVNQDISYSLALGKYWTEVTKGRGTFHSCNAKKGSYRYLGIGKVTHADTEMHAALHGILVYLTKGEQAIATSGMRSFGFSKPVQPTPKAQGGRPRNASATSIFIRPNAEGHQGYSHE